MTQLPLLDFSHFTCGSSEQKVKFCHDLVDSFAKYGFVQLENHDISPETLKSTFELSREFFDLPLEKKMKAAHPPRPNPHRGYSYISQESIAGVSGFEKGRFEKSPVVDVKVGEKLRMLYKCLYRQESFDQGASTDTLFPNVWPEAHDLPAFRPKMEDYFVLCHNMMLSILRALAMGCSLPENHFAPLHTAQEHELRILHYPETPLSELRRKDRMRIAEHTDFGTLTLLFQDNIGGLEIEDQKNEGKFFPVHCAQPVLLVNVGDSLQRWTNDVLKSACHRVTLPHDLKDQAATEAEEKAAVTMIPERYSIAFFGKPNRQASLKPFDTFVDEKMPDKYGHITALEYNQMKLVRTY